MVDEEGGNLAVEKGVQRNLAAGKGVQVGGMAGVLARQAAGVIPPNPKPDPTP